MTCQMMRMMVLVETAMIVMETVKKSRNCSSQVMIRIAFFPFSFLSAVRGKVNYLNEYICASRSICVVHLV